MQTQEIKKKANKLFQDFNTLKIDEEMTGECVETFRIHYIKEINTFFKLASENSDDVEFHNTLNKNEEYSNGVFILKNAHSPFDIELVCYKRHVNVPKWFKKICMKYLSIQFEDNPSLENYRCTEVSWMWEEIKVFKDTTKSFQSEGETLLQTIDRLGTNSNKFNLFGNDDKPKYDLLELQGLIYFLSEDFDLYGWDVETSLGFDEFSKETTYLNFHLDDTRYELYETFLELRQKHPPSKTYKIIRNSVHKANQDYLNTHIS